VTGSPVSLASVKSGATRSFCNHRLVLVVEASRRALRPVSPSGGRGASGSPVVRSRPTLSIPLGPGPIRIESHWTTTSVPAAGTRSSDAHPAGSVATDVRSHAARHAPSAHSRFRRKPFALDLGLLTLGAGSNGSSRVEVSGGDGRCRLRTLPVTDAAGYGRCRLRSGWLTPVSLSELCSGDSGWGADSWP